MQVDRTKCRPVASGVLTPFQGLSFLGLQLLLGLGILLQLNNYRLLLILSRKVYLGSISACYIVGVCQERRKNCEVIP